MKDPEGQPPGPAFVLRTMERLTRWSFACLGFPWLFIHYPLECTLPGRSCRPYTFNMPH